jgi:hypothetical protein
MAVKNFFINSRKINRHIFTLKMTERKTEMNIKHMPSNGKMIDRFKKTTNNLCFKVKLFIQEIAVNSSEFIRIENFKVSFFFLEWKYALRSQPTSIGYYSYRIASLSIYFKNT